MNILYVNTCFFGGGAEKIARQLYYKMPDKDTKTFFMAGRYQKDLPPFVEVIYENFFERVISAFLGIINHNFLFRTIWARKKIIKIVKRQKIDIVHFHNIHGNYIGPADIREIKKYCRNIVMTMHDMWLLTGCCPHGMSCNKWKKDGGCKHCDGNEWLKKGTKRAKFYLRCKIGNLSRQGIYFISPSKWLIDCCGYSYLADENIRLIPNGIDMESFHSLNKREMRKKLNIPVDKHILLFSAHKVDSPYKGFEYLYNALKQLHNKNQYCLLIIGKEAKKLELSFETYYMGYIENEQKMNEIYSAADLFIVPSMAETFSLTTVESMASGTPVLAFRTGGISEIVTDEVGWIVEKGNSQLLSDMIGYIFENDRELKTKTCRCRKYVETHFSEGIMISNYKNLYNQIVTP